MTSSTPQQFIIHRFNKIGSSFFQSRFIFFYFFFVKCNKTTRLLDEKNLRKWATKPNFWAGVRPIFLFNCLNPHVIGSLTTTMILSCAGCVCVCVCVSSFFFKKGKKNVIASNHEPNLLICACLCGWICDIKNWWAFFLQEGAKKK